MSPFDEKKLPCAAVYLAREGDVCALLAEACKREWGMETLPTIAKTAAGKPFFPAFPDCHFSLSHSGEWRVCGLFEGEIGVDVEIIRPRRAGLPRRVFREEMPWEEFYRRWTAMEACGKLTGRGIGAMVGQPLRLPEGVTLVQRRLENAWLSLCAEGAFSARFVLL